MDAIRQISLVCPSRLQALAGMWPAHGRPTPITRDGSYKAKAYSSHPMSVPLNDSARQQRRHYLHAQIALSERICDARLQTALRDGVARTRPIARLGSTLGDRP